jgi:hypothetical protein
MRGTSSGIVSRQWMSRSRDQRFLSLNDLHDSVMARFREAHETRAETRRLEFLAPANPTTIEETHDLWIGLPDGTEVAPSNWSFGQLAQLAKAPAAYLKTLPTQIVADALNYGMRFNRGVEALKAYHTKAELLAATGPDYGRIFDHEVVAAVQQIAGNGVGDTRWKVPGVMDWQTLRYNPDAPVTLDSTTLYASDRDVFIFLVDDRNPIEIGRLANGEPDLIFRGFIITNSEVGKSALKLISFYLRGVCQNRCLWGIEQFEEITMRHSKYAPSRFMEEARPALLSYAEGSTASIVQGVERARAAQIADTQEGALAFLQARNFSRAKAQTILDLHEREEGRPARSAWDFAQALTADARSIQFTDERFEQELVAKRILDAVA